MRSVLIVLALTSSCATDEECEPYIEYDREPGPRTLGCHNLEFYEIMIPSDWYPVDTRARVNECKPGGMVRLFECEPDGSWRELFLYPN